MKVRGSKFYKWLNKEPVNKTFINCEGRTEKDHTNNGTMIIIWLANLSLVTYLILVSLNLFNGDHLATDRASVVVLLVTFVLFVLAFIFDYEEPLSDSEWRDINSAAELERNKQNWQSPKQTDEH